jgi:hypothetical protein
MLHNAEMRAVESPSRQRSIKYSKSVAPGVRRILIVNRYARFDPASKQQDSFPLIALAGI